MQLKLANFETNEPEAEDNIRLGEDGWKARYYQVKMNLSEENEADKHQLQKMFYSYAEVSDTFTRANFSLSTGFAMGHVVLLQGLCFLELVASVFINDVLLLLLF